MRTISLLFGALAVCLAASPAHSASAAQCDEARANVPAIESALSFAIDAHSSPKVGDAVTIRWSLNDTAPSALSGLHYLTFRMNSDVRLGVARDRVLEKAVRGAKKDWEFASTEGPGFVVLPAQAEGFGLGPDTNSSELRVVVPLGKRMIRSTGTFSIHPQRAGVLTIDPVIEMPAACAHAPVRVQEAWRRSIEPGTAQVVLQDQFEVRGTDTSRSANGRYVLNSVGTSYTVFDDETDAVILRRAGRKPRFSPTGRFIVADISSDDSSDAKREIIDLVAGRVIFNASSEIRWHMSDAYLHVLPPGGLAASPDIVVPTFVDRIDGEERGLPRVVGVTACNACEHSSARFDWATGLTIFSNADSVEYPLVADLATHQPLCCTRDEKLATKLGQITGAQDYRLPRLAARLKVAVVDPAPFYPPLPIRKPDQPALAAQSVSRSLAWRTATRDNAQALATSVLIERLTEMGFSVSMPSDDRLDVVYAGPFARQSGLRATAGAFQSAETARVAMVKEFPEFEDKLVRALTCGTEGYELTMCDGNDARADFAHLDAVWLWTDAGRTHFIAQFSTDAFGSRIGGRHGAVLLLSRDTDGKAHLTNLTRDLNFGFEDVLKVERLGDQLTLASRRSAFVASCNMSVCKLGKNVSQLEQSTDLQKALVTTDGRFQIQTNANGELFFHHVGGRRNVLYGRVLDSETILFDEHGYYWSRFPEGAHFVNLRFRGDDDVHSFAQFAHVLNAPDKIARIIADPTTRLDPPVLTVPPAIGSLRATAGAGKVDVEIVMRRMNSDGEFRVFQDGVLTDRISVRQNENTPIEERYTVDRLPSARWLSVVALNEQGIASTPVGVDLGADTEHPRNIHVLAIGIDAYADTEIEDLDVAESDARLFAATIAEASARPGSHSTVASVSVLDAPSATAARIEQAVADLVSAANTEDTIALFFAGHGLQGVDGKYYLALTATRRDDIEGTSLPWSRVSEILANARARVVVFLDACQSGAAGETVLATNDGAVGSLLDRAPPNILVFAASKGREYSFEDSSRGGGHFTLALSETLKNDRAAYDANENGAIEVSELYRAVRRKVVGDGRTQREKLSKELGLSVPLQQTPWIARHQLVGDFALF